jgi:membrane protein implicated in regulation of membrane protease activity
LIVTASKIMKLFMITGGVVVFDILMLSPGFLGIGFGRSALQTAMTVSILLASTLVLLFGIYSVLMKQNVRLPVKQMKNPEDLEGALKQFKGVKSLAQEIALAMHQLERMSKKQETLRSVLNQRFEPSGLSFQKFAYTTQEVEKLFFHNIRSMINRLHVFDEDEFQSIAKQNTSQLSPELLQEKRTVYKAHISFIKTSLHMNEEILFKLDKLLLEITRLDSLETGDIGQMPGMQEIDALIKQTQFYKQ